MIHKENERHNNTVEGYHFRHAADNVVDRGLSKVEDGREIWIVYRAHNPIGGKKEPSAYDRPGRDDECQH